VGQDGRSLAAAVVRVTSGNFFPEKDPFASLMLSLGIFGAGFLMRPLGAIILGASIDHYGRRRGLIVTLGMIAIGLLLMAVTPSYATIGIAAPIIVVVGRIIQGLSAGVELGGVSVYLAETAPPGQSGFSLAYSLATAIFGGFTPAICTRLIHSTADRAMPGLWLSVAALLGLIATVLATGFHSRARALAWGELAGGRAGAACRRGRWHRAAPGLGRFQRRRCLRPAHQRAAIYSMTSMNSTLIRRIPASSKGLLRPSETGLGLG
jgi:MFS family permease